MIDLLRRLLIGTPSETAAKEPEVVESRVEGEGPLFGLHPPQGHFFKVEADRDGEYWHVCILDEKTYRSVTSYCASNRYEKSDEIAIKRAADMALKKFYKKANREATKQKYEGNYPPKRTS